MLNKLRNFAKTKIAGVVIGIIIIPFVFWGMGGVFSGGNKNNIAKINNKSISTQDFMDHLNSSRISLETIKQNIENNIFEEILTELISKKMIQLEEQNLNNAFTIELKNILQKIDKEQVPSNYTSFYMVNLKNDLPSSSIAILNFISLKKIYFSS